MIRSIISRDTSSRGREHHVTSVQYGSTCSYTTINYCTTWLVVFMYNYKLLYNMVGCVHVQR